MIVKFHYLTGAGLCYVYVMTRALSSFGRRCPAYLGARICSSDDGWILVEINSDAFRDFRKSFGYYFLK